MINISMLQDELQNFVTGASDIQGAALVSPDGLAINVLLLGIICLVISAHAFIASKKFVFVNS